MTVKCALENVIRGNFTVLTLSHCYSVDQVKEDEVKSVSVTRGSEELIVT